MPVDVSMNCQHACQVNFLECIAVIIFLMEKKPFDVSTLSEPFKILNCVCACVPKITDEEF